jgi:ABC-type bacteriocin/lantibiotic exporter with double-glycine peptidase domain
MAGFETLLRKTYLERWMGSVLALLLFGVSCATTAPSKAPETARVIKNVPFYPQEEFQCGPSSLAGVLNYRGIRVSPEEIGRQIYSKSAKGTLTLDLILYAERTGLRVMQYRGSAADLRTNIDSDNPLIVMVDYGFLSYQVNHYMVVVGYSDEGIIVNSGRHQHQFLPWKGFLRSWEKTSLWALAIKPK